jgi:hypothetical protein
MKNNLQTCRIRRKQISTDGYLSRPESGSITLSHVTKIWRGRPATPHRQTVPIESYEVSSIRR